MVRISSRSPEKKLKTLVWESSGFFGIVQVRPTLKRKSNYNGFSEAPLTVELHRISA